MLALPLTAVLILHAHAAEMGFLTAAELAPHLLLSIGVGAWLDRRESRRRVMVAADLGRAAVLATIPLAYAFDALTLAQVYAVAFAVGCLSVFFDVSYTTIYVAAAGRERLLEASGLVAQSRAASWVGGPSLAGALVQLLSAPVALLVDAASFVASAFCLGGLRIQEPPVEAASASPARGRLLQGLRFIASTPIYRASLGGTATLNLFTYMFSALFVLYATRSLHVRPGTLGIVLAVGAVGSVIGSLVAARIGRAIGIGPAFVVGSVLFPLPLALVPLAGGPHALVLACLFAAEFFGGAGVMVLDVNANPINTAITPDRLRARVTGAHRFVNYGIRPVGALVGGALGATIGLRPTLWIGSLGALLALLWLVPSPIPRLRELPAEAGERVPA
jgi:MFS family permease